MVVGGRNRMPEANLRGVGGMTLAEVASFDLDRLPEEVRRASFHDGNWMDWSTSEPSQRARAV
jgi:hypothetical protein